MRRALLVLTLFLFAALPVDASEGRNDFSLESTFPDVQWNASVDIGYISTAPLVKNGLVIVKGGGDPMTGEGAGIVAYRADTGAEVWRTIHTASEMGFETAPLLHIPNSAHFQMGCSPSSDLVVTGWTSGQLSAYELATGNEVWNQSTSAPMWGITGGGLLNNQNEIVWPTETGVIKVCAANGTILNIHEDSTLRTYRANLGEWGAQFGWLQGTESAQLLRYDWNLELIESIDLPTLANLSGTWKIRSTPIKIIPSSSLIHLQGEGQSKLIRMDLNESGSPVLLDVISLGPGTATTPAGAMMVSDWGDHLPIAADSNDAIHYEIVNGTLTEQYRLNATQVVGEISSIQLGQVNAICLPQNRADGSWYIGYGANQSIEWIPDQTGYVTAGCGSDGTVHAVANDASWLEVRYDPIHLNSIHSRADSALGISESTEPEIESTSETEENGIPGIAWLPFFGAVIFAIFAQFAVDLDTRRLIRIGAVIMVMLGLVMVGMIYNSEIVAPPEEDSSQRTRVSTLYSDIDEFRGDNEALVAFHFPASFAPDGCNSGTIVLASGTTFGFNNSFSDCILVTFVEINSESTVQSATEFSLSEHHLNHEIEQQILGLFLRDIEGATGGADGRWWSYDLNGGYGTIGMAEQALQPGDHVDWHFDVGQF